VRNLKKRRRYNFLLIIIATFLTLLLTSFVLAYTTSEVAAICWVAGFDVVLIAGCFILCRLVLGKKEKNGK
jgi:uncharacterized membrane protein HdeD (DUF308 family)